MGATTPTKIHLLGSGRYEEFVAAGAITPGMLLAQDTNGAVVAHATAGGPAERLFAVEDALQGKTIADAYASGDVVECVLAAPGDVVYAWLNAGEGATRNEFLTSTGEGTLKVATGTDKIIAVPVENVDNTASDAVDVRIKVRIL